MVEKILIKCTKISDKAKVPEDVESQLKSNGFLGSVIRAIDDYVIYPNKVVSINTGLSFEVPLGFEGKLTDIESNIKNKSIIIPNSPKLIHSGDFGEVEVLIMNIGEKPVAIHSGDEVAYLTFNRVYCGVIIEKFK